jgi:hypothetical protein
LREHKRSYAQATDVKHGGHRELAPELVNDGSRQDKARNLCINQYDMNVMDSQERVSNQI